MKRKLIAFMNAYTQGISGGDVCFIEIAKRLDGYNKIVVTSLLGKKLCKSKGLTANYLITTKEQQFKKVISTYIKRILKALSLKIDISAGDILYSTSDFLPDVIPAFVRKISKREVKWIQKVFHLISPDRIVPYYAQKISFLFIKYFADLIIVDNDILRRDLIAQGFSKERVVVNHLGINLKYFQSLTVSSKTGYDAVFLGRLHPSKGIFDLIKIWKIVIKNKPELKLGIIGSGDVKITKKFKEEILKEGLQDSMDLLGYLEDNEAFSVLKKSKIFVFPTREEGFGLAVAEAMACGLPVVAWDLPVFKEVFPKGMLRIPMGEFEKFAKSILELVKNENLYKKLTTEAKEIIQHFDWNVVAERELNLIENLF